jgi:biotin-[acetyl-CoA-carboxylase] ligase BirA-like protein
MGYQEQDLYDIPALHEALSTQGYRLVYQPVVNSTMRVVEDLAAAGNEPPLIALADHQNEGVGRQGREWQDRSYASVLMSALLELPAQSAIATLSDLVALRTLMALSDVTGMPDLQIKWPNDFVINDKKVGGMLAQNVYQGKAHRGVNVGIGINVHYSQEEMDAYATDYGATALDVHAARPIRRQRIVESIGTAVRNLAIDAVAMDGNPNFRRDYDLLLKAHSAVFEREVQVLRREDEVISGRVVDMQIGRGIRVQSPRMLKWFNHFDPDMKVRVMR